MDRPPGRLTDLCIAVQRPAGGHLAKAKVQSEFLEVHGRIFAKTLSKNWIEGAGWASLTGYVNVSVNGY